MAGAAGIFVYVGAEVALGSYMVNYGLNLNVHELMQSHPFLENMAGLAASIKGQSVMDLDPKGKVGSAVDLLLGRGHGRTFHWRWVDAAVEAILLLGVFSTIALALVVASSMATGLSALLYVVGGGSFQFDHVPHDFHAGNC